jgi:hypothetical protein
MHPDTEETVEVVQGMKDKHFYIDENGVEWVRVWEPTSLAVDTGALDPYSQDDFVNKTRGKNYSVGDMWDLSRELHEKRKAKDGKDNIKAKHNKDRANQMQKKQRARIKAQTKHAQKKS